VAALINRGSTAEYLKPAEAFLERALQLDPNNVDALAAKGWVDMDLGAGFMTRCLRAPPIGAENVVSLTSFRTTTGLGDQFLDSSCSYLLWYGKARANLR
jgi:hypothetical protein